MDTLTKEQELVSFIDSFLAQYQERNSFSKKEVYNFCLDIRSIMSN